MLVMWLLKDILGPQWKLIRMQSKLYLANKSGFRCKAPPCLDTPSMTLEAHVLVVFKKEQVLRSLQYFHLRYWTKIRPFAILYSKFCCWSLAEDCTWCWVIHNLYINYISKISSLTPIYSWTKREEVKVNNHGLSPKRACLHFIHNAEI